MAKHLFIMMDLLRQPSTGITPENVITVWNAVVENHGRPSMTLWFFHGTCQWFLSEQLNFAKHCCKVHVTTAEWLMKMSIINVCSELEKQLQTLNFLSNLITGDKSWVYEYEPESSDHFTRRAQVKSIIKSLCICFFGTDGITHKEFILPDWVITGELCCSKTAKRDK